MVKVAKPQQDMRFDVPTIGLGTLETMVEAGGRVLAVEAGRTILLDRAAALDYREPEQTDSRSTGGPRGADCQSAGPVAWASSRQPKAESRKLIAES